MKTLKIDRKKWARGGKNGPAALLNKYKCMCCLGFHALQFTKATEGDISNYCYPEDVGAISSKKTVLNNARFTRKAAVINDMVGIEDPERESRLKKLFKTKKYNIEFTG